MQKVDDLFIVKTHFSLNSCIFPCVPESFNFNLYVIDLTFMQIQHYFLLRWGIEILEFAIKYFQISTTIFVIFLKNFTRVLYSSSLLFFEIVKFISLFIIYINF